MPNLDATAIASIQSLQHQAASLLLYRELLKGAVSQAFLHLLQVLRDPEAESAACLDAYGNWFNTLASTGENWQEYGIQQILRADNPFSRQVQHINDLADLPKALVEAAKHDLKALQSLYCCNSTQVSQWVQQAAKLPVAPVEWTVESQLSSLLSERENWAEALEDLTSYYRQNGVGIFAEYRAFRWQKGKLAGVTDPDRIRVQALAGYSTQREALLKNTEFLLAGYPALHVLLYGSRGSGKSSLVKGLLHEYRQLRLVEVAKSELQDLPQIVEILRNVPQKFIIFVDDLSFEEDDEAFKALKVVLEGSITARPQNVVVYATSNRRHLIREFFGDRPRPSQADEIQAWDTVQEKLSFSDRFGLTLTFEPANQDTYLEIVRHLANLAEINLDWEEVRDRALQWATRHNGRSGRTARQFIDFLTAELALSQTQSKF